MKTKARKKQLRCRFVVRALFSLAPLSVFLPAWTARAQEGLSDAMAMEAADKARAKQALISDYTFRSGDFRMLLKPSLSMEWNDNVNLTQTGQEQDFIILPTMGAIMNYPLTSQNLLQLNVTGGYWEYIKHPNLSTWYVSTESGLSFNIYVKDILINLHEQPSYVQNSVENAQVAGTGSYGTFANTAGLSVQWSSKWLALTVGYDHQDSLTTSSQFSYGNNSSDDAYTRAGYLWNSKLTTGLEGTYSFTGFNQNVLNDTASYSVGIYGDWHPDTFLEIEPRVGASFNQYSQTSAVQTSSLNTWYADLTITHKINRSLNYSIDGGRDVSPGVQSTADVNWHVNTEITWNFIRNFSFSPQLFFQHGNQGQGSTVNAGLPNLPPTLLQQNEVYNWYGGSLGFSYAITRRFTVGWNYQFTQRTSSLSNRGYTQNIIGIQITYRPI